MYTLFATWNKAAGGHKTITGCTVGKPIIFVHKTLNNLEASNWCYIKPLSGCINGTTTGHHYLLGTYFFNPNGVDGGGVCSMVLIPTAASVVIDISNNSDDDCVYVYK